MKSLMKKVRGNKKGFTLAELLVVVAIIGILVAISIPVFTAQLTKARKATNLANLRAAKAAAVAEYLTGEEEGEATYNYDIASGKVTLVDGTTVTKADATTERKLDDSAATGDEVEGDGKYTKFSVKISTKNGTSTENAVYVYADK